MVDKMVKKDLIVLIVSVTLLIIATLGFSYAYFMSVDKGEDNIINIGDLKVSFCIDETCQKDYANFGQVIGTKSVDGKSVIESIYPYSSDAQALTTDPYIFNIKNTGSLKTYVTIKLNEDKDYVLNGDYENYKNLTETYSNYIKVAISRCDTKVERENATIMKYGELENNVLLSNVEFDSGSSQTFCLWTYLDSSTPNEVQDTYFVANLDFSAEYKPN